MSLAYAKQFNANKNKNSTTTTKKRTPIVQQVQNKYKSYTNQLAGSSKRTPNYAAMNAANEQAKKYNDRLTVHYGGTTTKSSGSSSGSSYKAHSSRGGATNINSGSTPTTSTVQQKQNNNSYNEWLAKILANARNAYNNNMNAINSMYGDRMNALNSRYGAGRDTLAATNAQSQEALRKAKEQAQRQAYIQSQEAERDMEQNLSAQGLSGGASESTLASLKNNYASNRNSNEEEYLDNSASLNIAYQNDLASLENQYQQLIDALNSERAQAIMQNENALANAGTATINQFADYAYNMDYMNANAALSQQAQAQQAELNDYYAAKQAERDLANKINFAQFENNLKQTGSNESAALQRLRSKLRSAGYTEDDINSLLLA